MPLWKLDFDRIIDKDESSPKLLFVEIFRAKWEILRLGDFLRFEMMPKLQLEASLSNAFLRFVAE